MAESYGMPHGSNSGGYGGNGVKFPDWVYQLGNAFGVKPSTYPGHQETNRNEAGYAPNPQLLNRGIDWAAPGTPDEIDRLTRFADYLFTVRGSLEQVIWQNPNTGRRVGVAGGKDVTATAYYDYDGGYNKHRNHVHTRQSAPVPAPGGAPPPPPLSRADGYALRIIAEGRRRGITPKGIQIALVTGIVESNITVYANSKLPKSLALPHDAVGSDGLSVGIFQQQVKDTGNGWWWGDEATCMGVESSAGLFYDRLVKLPYNGTSKTPGGFAQQIQGSAFPDRYDQHWGEAVALYNRLADTQPPTGDDELSAEDSRKIDLILKELQQKHPSRSAVREPGEGLVDTWAGMDLNTDGNVDLLASALRVWLGHKGAIARVKRVAAGTEPGRSPDDKDLANALLAELLGTPRPAATVVNTTAAPQASFASELADAVAENARLRDEISRLNVENMRLQAAAITPPPPAALPAVIYHDDQPRTMGERVGNLVNSMEDYTELALTMNVKQRAAMAKSIAAFQMETNGSPQ